MPFVELKFMAIDTIYIRAESDELANHGCSNSRTVATFGWISSSH